MAVPAVTGCMAALATTGGRAAGTVTRCWAAPVPTTSRAARATMCGAGVDSFIFARGDGPDWIVDFEAGVEMLRLEGIAADEVPQTLKSYWEHEGLELTFGDGDQIYLQGVTAPLAERDLVFG